MTKAIAHPQAAIATEVRHRLRLQLAVDHSINPIEADRIITDMLSFLTVCAANPHQRFRPSRQVDLGWHQFILNTHDYAEFCERVAGRFIHHVPDEFVAPERRATANVLRPTVEAIKAAGLPLHPELWAAGGGRCSQCHSGCTSCGQGDDPSPHRI
ncbi:hypothetical protein BBK82_46890 [Lentzea guizhouensis]|uniref:Uncharacterized protein n=1 Tax=Lentzea guizhouensis TaxID=1586287 RepID=A0A1B2HXB9_9PSEU|nr:hypothetical protein [Lentzea guizhouensis]ANZ42335.1 hypothetical protein BBK82_46890 [Lentzea guizhouensis]